ncbi:MULTISPECIES: threonine/serine dehydratase [unclassified Crossiella]|uniref:threonine ammonia-lyase n=1 Tax=unclassified Crossiella TaxID=2620835 RepID=UPI00200058B9|nr:MULTISPECIES: pyridoxal-phosphate dependent enzyme [unclassified Crossiella]MCK2244054.1 pyridoxal-phosphate dependent enzyme [Crossiella sp. S99.2]MCK2257088.1 pyridoxal-phosphate dependent enzyme [Crossiella sp. S99.1]
MTDLSLDRILAAAKVIDPVFLNSPQYVDEQLCAALGRRVLTKVELLNPLRSFKGRGAEFFVSEVAEGIGTIVCSSTGGNFGQAVAYAARRRGLRAEVFVPSGTSPVKLARMRAFGAVLHEVDGSPLELAEAYAAETQDRVYVLDGRDPAVAEGAGTIGMELLRDNTFDTLVVPMGDGALISGVAAWVKAHAPAVRVIGVAAAAAPALARSWAAGEVLTVELASTFAAGIAISRPTEQAVARTRALVDEVVLVSEEELRQAMRLAARTLGVLPEPAGAAGLAAIAKGIPGETVATVLTGGNADLAGYAGLGAGN